MKFFFVKKGAFGVEDTPHWSPGGSTPKRWNRFVKTYGSTKSAGAEYSSDRRQLRCIIMMAEKEIAPHAKLTPHELKGIKTKATFLFVLLSNR